MSHILPNPNTPQLEVIDLYMKSLATFDFAALKTLTTDEFRMITAPASMGVPDKAKSEDIAFLEKLKEILNGQHLEYTIHDVVDGQGKTWVHAKLETLNIEVVYIFTFGTGIRALKIAQVIEFSDSKRYLEVDPSPSS